MTQWAGMFLFDFLLSMKRPVKRSAIMENDESVSFGRITSNFFVVSDMKGFLYFRGAQLGESIGLCSLQ